ncbi:oocyst wall protein [Cyclospora cayetanensis]|uniref:Oocyst wall protein n=1 Tax=Cyclospora cayetanensis TaxID=88456 RepID=A0A1D3D4X3_9EIME|nr:oocyst wall protein [Cyclospora cayetanensis]
MVDGLCITPAAPVLECPNGYINICKAKDRAESPCCAKGHTAEKIARCREGMQSQDGYCTSIVAHEAVTECPAGYALINHGLQCIKQERGQAAAACVAPDVLSAEGDSCLRTMQQGYEYICPDEYQCIAYAHTKKKYSPVCSACAKTTEMQPLCGCPEGQIEVQGYCFEEDVYGVCQRHQGMPRKQAPSKRQPVKPTKKGEEAPEPSCSPVGRVSCSCEESYTLHCTSNICTCINREIIPVVPICRGELDESGKCMAQVKTPLLYTCAEGFTCDVVNKKGRCHCVRVAIAEPSARCAAGEPHKGKCMEVVREQKIVECPQGYSETCCDNHCSCTKTHLATREVKCASGAVSIQGECVYVSQPSPGCEVVSLAIDLVALSA